VLELAADWREPAVVDVIAPFLAQLFHQSLSVGVVPGAFEVTHSTALEEVGHGF